MIPVIMGFNFGPICHECKVVGFYKTTREFFLAFLDDKKSGSSAGTNPNCGSFLLFTRARAARLDPV